MCVVSLIDESAAALQFIVLYQAFLCGCEDLRAELHGWPGGCFLMSKRESCSKAECKGSVGIFGVGEVRKG